MDLHPGESAMAIQIHKERSPRAVAPSLLVWILLFALSGCGEKIEPEPGVQADDGLPAVAEPLMQHDLDDIRRSGILRIITFYSPRTYFIHKGGQAGFDYELLWWFARERDLTVEVIIPDPGEDPVHLLNTGQGDLICAGLVPDTELQQYRRLDPTHQFRPQGPGAAGGRGASGPALDGLMGLTITLPQKDPFRDDLLALRDRARLQFFVSTARPHQQAEDLVTDVSQGRLEAVVVDDILARSAMTYLPNLALGPFLGERQPNVWLLSGKQPRPEGRPQPLPQGTPDRGVERPDAPERDLRHHLRPLLQERIHHQRFQEHVDRPDKSGDHLGLSTS